MRSVAGNRILASVSTAPGAFPTITAGLCLLPSPAPVVCKLSFPASLRRFSLSAWGCFPKAAFAALLLAGWSPVRGEIRLSEFLAANADVIQDDDGDKSDYIEIYNPGADPVNLAGYSLTVDKAAPRQWIFPSLTLRRGEYLLVWASGKNRTDPAKPLHTGFKLEKSGGYLALIPPSTFTPATVFDPYPPQVDNRSYGLYQPEILTRLVAEGASCKWLVPEDDFVKWRTPDYNDSSWRSATTGIGFDASTPGLDYSVYFGSGGDTESAMLNQATSCYVRLPFQMTSLEGLSTLKLRARYDDGMVAALNATTIATGNAPAVVRFNSTANGIRDEEDAVSLEETDVTPFLANLRSGKNVLSFQVLNASLSNTDILLSPELELGRLDLTRPVKTGYFATPTPAAANSPAADGFTGDTKFNVDRGLFTAPFDLTITGSTPGAVIRYTLDCSVPTLANGQTWTAPITISKTTVVRAAAFGAGLHPSNVDTQTYAFPASVIRQSGSQPGFPSTWGTTVSPTTGFEVPVPADYAMDQSVVNDAAYSGSMEQALSSTLPIVSLTGVIGQFFDSDGIYANGREGSNEVPISMEWFGPGLSPDGQIDCGVRIHGGNAREHPKKPMRLYFRKKYGTDKLRYPFYPGSGVSTFNQLLLRPGGHDGWAVPFGNDPFILAPHATYTRDRFQRLTENDMGHISPESRYVHVYLNGLYWGIYDLEERPNADYYSSHYGGEPEDWDVIHHPSYIGENYSQVDGDGGSWDEVLARADAGVNSDEDYAALAAMIDLDSYIDSLIVRIWAGDYDWCSPIYLRNGNQEGQVGYFDNKNWYAARRSRTVPGGYVFHSWDGEMSMGTHLMTNLFATGGSPPSWLTYPPAQDVAGFDSTRVGTQGSVAWPYAQMRGFPAFRRKFADHLQRHFFNGGAMTTEANQARLDSLTAQLQLPILAESARWGDVNRNDPYNIALTPDTHWKPEINWLRNTFIAGRNALVLSQF
ncbi:MAG: hypothetical protein EOP86_16405, partial [Verrucomicrobiaceae bacterium]